MKRTTPKNRVGRIVAAGLGLALAGGMSLVAVAPANAATDATTTNITSADIKTGWNWFDDWHAGDANSGTYDVTSAGLALSNGAQVVDSIDPAPNFADLRTAITSKAISWTTGSGSVHLQLQFGGANVPITLTGPAATSGVSYPALTDTWTITGTSELVDITGYDVGTYADGDQDTLANFLTAVAKYTTDTDNNGFTGFGLSADAASAVTGATWDNQTFTFMPPLPAGTVKIAGTAGVGQTLTATPAGWPDGTKFTYQWGGSRIGAQFGGEFAGATGTTYTIPADKAGWNIGVTVTGTKTGFASTQVGADNLVSVPAKAAAAPASDSSSLTSYLSSKKADKQAQTTVGLPSGQLDVSKGYTANLSWSANDSFVDVYLYPTPTLVGTFPVVNGKVQITLSSAVLSKLAGVSHTLVGTGQTSGAVQAVALMIKPALLQDTGSNLTVPLSAAAIMLLLGGALVVARRRRMAHQA